MNVVDLGCLGYAEAMRRQDALVEARLRGEVPDTLLLVEHPPVITLGRRGSMSDIYLSEAQLAELGIEVQHATRGGLVTYHGPGQLVGYPIVSLRERRLRLPAYVHALEAAIVSVLADLGISAWSEPEQVGVWTERGKIAAIGIAQRHGVSLHGFAVNLQPNLAHFALINPCGLGARGVTSAAAILGRPVDSEDFKLHIAPALDEFLFRTNGAGSKRFLF